MNSRLVPHTNPAQAYAMARDTLGGLVAEDIARQCVDGYVYTLANPARVD